MDASRLLAVLDDIEAETEGGLTRNISALLQQYTAARDSATVDNAPAIQKALAALVDYIEDGKFPQYPPSKSGVLRAIGGDTRVGPGLKERLITLLSFPCRDKLQPVSYPRLPHYKQTFQHSRKRVPKQGLVSVRSI